MGLRVDASGGTFNKAIADIMEAESRPLKQLQKNKETEQKRLKVFQDFKAKFGGVQAALDEMSSFKKFRELKVDLGDGGQFIDVTVDKERAQPGTYRIEVEELAGRSSLISNSFADKEEPALGMGFVVVYDNEGESHEIFIDYNDASLQGVANKINAIPNLPVQASVIKDSTEPETTFRLLISAKKDGSAENIDLPEFYFLDGAQDFWVEDDREAYNALVTIDDYEIELDSNEVPDFIQGVNLKLKQARPDQPITVTITEDYEKIAGKMKSLMEKLSEILDFINQQHKVDADSDTRSQLTGDTGLQGMEYRIRNLLHEAFPVFDPKTDEYRLIHGHDMGISFNREGKLNFDEKKFQSAIERDFDGVAEAVTGEFGLAFQASKLFQGYTRPGNGALAVREQGMRSRIDSIDGNIKRMEDNLERRAKSLTERFGRLQASLQSMQQQQAYLAANLGGGGGGNLMAQLLGG